jgi:hypothetical protein
MSAIKINGQWKTPSVVYAKVEGQWKIVGQAYSKVDGLWRQTTFASPPARPVMQYVSTGVFQITNYNSSLLYESQFVGGSGSASLNTSNGRYTLNGANSAFNVVSRYASGSPPSEAGYMERKAYSYTFRLVPRSETYFDQPCRLDADAFCNPGNVQPCANPSWGQWGCPTEMCWIYYNGVVCTQYSRTVYDQVYDVLINEPGYTNGGSEWYKAT